MSESNPTPLPAGAARTTSGVLGALPHDLLVAVAREHMITGHLIDRALMPELVMAAGMDAMEPVAIDEWMGASPNYTARMRALMGIEGDSVEAIFKALQLDVGFVHEYMDVAYAVGDAHHGEFWLRHCGALVDAEPMGEAQVVSMCHHIEDPTFDATAYATNPRARIRPVHRPPRSPADRVPVCHWTVVVDPANDPVGPAPLTTRMAGSALVALPLPERERTGDGLDDYTGAFRADLRLRDLSSGALRAVSREFLLQSQLIAAAAQVTVGERHGTERARDIGGSQAQGVAWVAAQRVQRALHLDADLDAIATLIALSPLWPSGVEATATPRPDGAGVTVTVDAAAAVLDPAEPGWLGLLACGDTRALAATAQAVAPGARVEGDGPWFVAIDPAADAVRTPRVVELLRFSSAADWRFTR